jgi:hypothetical protein
MFAQYNKKAKRPRVFTTSETKLKIIPDSEARKRAALGTDLHCCRKYSLKLRRLESNQMQTVFFSFKKTNNAQPSNSAL